MARTIPEPAPELPVLHEETKAGSIVATPARERRRRTAKMVDGAIGDWTGTPTGLGGSRCTRTASSSTPTTSSTPTAPTTAATPSGWRTLDPLNEGVPETYRLEPIFQADLAGELGIAAARGCRPRPRSSTATLARSDGADLLELRRRRRRGRRCRCWPAPRRWRRPADAAVLVLLDTAPGSTARTRALRQRAHDHDGRRRRPAGRRRGRGRRPGHRQRDAGRRGREPDGLHQRHRGGRARLAALGGGGRRRCAARGRHRRAFATGMPTCPTRRQRGQRRLPRRRAGARRGSTSSQALALLGGLDRRVLRRRSTSASCRRARTDAVAPGPRLLRADLHVVARRSRPRAARRASTSTTACTSRRPTAAARRRR